MNTSYICVIFHLLADELSGEIVVRCRPLEFLIPNTHISPDSTGIGRASQWQSDLHQLLEEHNVVSDLRSKGMRRNVTGMCCQNGQLLIVG